MMNRLCFLTVLLLLSLCAIAQEGTENILVEEPTAEDTTDVNNKIFRCTMEMEKQPEFPGGNTALMKYLAKNIRYPASARRLGIEGKVIIQFVVNQAGKITDVKVLRGLSEDCDKEAIRVTKSMPKWKPVRQGGKPVKVQMVMPVNYRL